MGSIFAMLVAMLGFVALILFIVYVLVPLMSLAGTFLGRVFKLIGGEIGDALRIVGAIITAVVFLPMALGSVVIGRWSAAKHYTGAARDEFAAAGACVYRICVGRPAWFLGLGSLTEGIERRVPDVVARAPGSDKPSRRTGSFEGYTVVGSLPPGGSGAKLYIAEPEGRKRDAFAAMGREDVGQVIIKSFSLHEGSSLPQIVRESRALEAAKNIGLVLEHELNDQRFFYVMPYVPGPDLSTAARRLHEQSGAGGLDHDKLRAGLSHAADLVETLARYHDAGLWHKDVKPDNIIIHDGRAHLVDLGLVTPLRSAMTLTTHGTEYFRDPELVRMALRGVKVHQVSGEKFDVYAAGAVLYAIIENSFPAHGGLSQIRKRCPESVRWIVRRAMAEYDKRYATAGEMLTDLRAVLAAERPGEVKPADLPSMQGGAEYEPDVAIDELADFTPPAPPPPAAAPEPEPEPAPAGADRRAPAIALVNWWTGKYHATPVAAPSGGGAAVAEAEPARARRGSPVPPPAHKPLPLERRDSAADQLKRARERVRARRAAAATRMRDRRRSSEPGVVGRIVGTFAAIAAVMIAGGLIVRAMTGDAKPFTAAGENGEFVAKGDDYAVFADPETGALRVTDREGRSLELDLDSEHLRSLAREWPQYAGEWRETVMSEIVPVFLRAQGREEMPDRADGSAGRWLLVDQMGSETPEADRAALSERLEALRANGAELVTADTEQGLELVSGATAAIGIGTPADPKTIERLDRYVREHPEIDGAVWLTAEGRAVAVSPFGATREWVRGVLTR